MQVGSTSLPLPRLRVACTSHRCVACGTSPPLQQALDGLTSSRFRDVTTIVIAHRLATIAHANTIFVMHAGHVAEQGSHGELLEQRGRYFEMVEAATAH